MVKLTLGWPYYSNFLKLKIINVLNILETEVYETLNQKVEVNEGAIGKVRAKINFFV